MEKGILGGKIKELRTVKGYSQEYLADLSQLSLRTIQRIENGETGARGDTLNRLAGALDVAIDKLTDLQPPPINNVSNNGYIAMMNLSALGCLFLYFPFLGLVLPLVFWLNKKDKFDDVNQNGKRILNFQITWAILFLMLIIFVLFFVGKIAGMMGNASPRWALGLPETILLSIYALILFNVVLTVINTARIIMHREIKYWPAFSFIK